MSKKINLKAFEDGRADQLLRETMEGHRVEPDPSLWKGISRKLLWWEMLHFNFSNLSLKYIFIGTAGLLVVATALYFGFPVATPVYKSTEPVVKVAPENIPVNNPGITPINGTLTRPNQKSDDKPVNTDRKTRVPVSAKSIEEGPEEEKWSKSGIKEPQTNSTKTLLAESLMTPDDSHETGLSGPGDGSLMTMPGITRLSPYPTSLLFKIPGTDTIITINNAAGILKFRKSSLTASRFFSANLGFTTELANYSEPEEYSKTNFWLNGGITYHISRFSVASGFGLGYVYDNGKYRVEYKSNDSIGFYNFVTSYAIGTDNEIIFQTQAKNVYDSLQHSADSRTKNRYSYLQVPVLLGYRFVETNRVSMTFQTGPAVSLLLGSRKSDPVIEYKDSRIIRVDNDTPSRVQTNWQIWANLYLEMRMNKQVSIYVEPSFKYYLKPMVTQENMTFKSPWTIGLGIGLQFNFGQKKTNP